MGTALHFGCFGCSFFGSGNTVRFWTLLQEIQPDPAFFPLPSPGTWACPEGHRAKHPQSFDKGKERQEETAETHGNTIRNCLRGVSSRAAMPGLWRYHQICAFAVRILVPSDRKYLGCSPVLRGAVFQCFSCLRPACTLTQSTLIRLCQAK